ncbi:MAG TPA: TlpA disulfide reductase family protein [Actinomycetota bacterium]|jgi:thiol-disulfide isomerase/thioredoxin
MRARRATALVLSLASTALVACGSDARSPAPGVVTTTGPAPEIGGRTLGGPALPDTDGKVLVVNFWNPYCPPCRVEAPVLEAASRRFARDGVEVVGVHYTGGRWPKSVPAALSFVRAAHLTYPVTGDPGARLAAGFGIEGIPSTVVVDAAGRMRFRVLGPVKAGVLDRLLAGVIGPGGSARAS